MPLFYNSHRKATGCHSFQVPHQSLYSAQPEIFFVKPGGLLLFRYSTFSNTAIFSAVADAMNWLMEVPSNFVIAEDSMRFNASSYSRTNGFGCCKNFNPIDLVMTIGKCGFLDAVNFLKKDFNPK